ncbi:Sucrose transport protein SUC2 [Striga hermonthica]|uniref:Sucrose transport protein SUC2 n=1 Tax=Striga hermonthica TaxID=68872 RepID=A0A9N7R414_STRHE|nr:Sucrose transport protein SUC2 [Striga hermonthica]
MVYLDVIDEPNQPPGFPEAHFPNPPVLRKLILVASIAAALQFGWALQLALLTPYSQLLGMSHKWASLVWLCGPVSGLVVQVIVGHYSDRCTSSLGRRRPFIIYGAASLSIGSLLIAFAADLSGPGPGPGPAAGAIFLAGFWMLDISNNVIQGPTRALLADISCGDNTAVTLGNGLFAFFMAVGNVLGYAAGAAGGLHHHLPFAAATNACDESCAHIKACFVLHVGIVGLVAGSVVGLVKEDPLDPFYLDELAGDDSERAPSFFAQIVIAARSTSRPMWVLYVVTAFNWVGIFPFLLYDTDWMGKEVYGGSVGGSAGERSLYGMGVRAGSRGLMLHVVTMGLVSLFLEPLIRVLGNVKRLWSLGNSMLTACMALTVVISAVASHARGGSGLPEVLEPPPPEVRAYCYGLFAIFGIPQAVSAD